jgi:hypothetical protein
MKRSSLWLFTSIGLLALLALAFLFLDFHLARSNTQVESQVSTSRSNPPDSGGLPENQELQIYVEGPAIMSAALRRELAIRLETSRYFSQVTILDAPQDIAGRPNLAVSIEDPQVLWTPFFARAEFNMRVGFASDGDISWRHEESPVLQFHGEPAVVLSGDFQIMDTTLGVISRPAYLEYLGEQAALRISESLEREIPGPPGS